MRNYYISKGVFIGRGLIDGGIHYVFRFENGYGASIIKGSSTYGGPQDLWELAVVRFFEEESIEYKVNYDTEITDNFCGYETDDGIRELLARIKALENPDK